MFINGKFKEIAYLISNKYKKISPLKLKIRSPKETGKTFISNSKLKANYFSKYVNFPVISDDSGLFSLEHPWKKRIIETNDKNFIFFILVFFHTITPTQ